MEFEGTSQYESELEIEKEPITLGVKEVLAPDVNPWEICYKDLKEKGIVNEKYWDPRPLIKSNKRLGIFTMNRGLGKTTISTIMAIYFFHRWGFQTAILYRNDSERKMSIFDWGSSALAIFNDKFGTQYSHIESLGNGKIMLCTVSGSNNGKITYKREQMGKKASLYGYMNFRREETYGNYMALIFDEYQVRNTSEYLTMFPSEGERLADIMDTMCRSIGSNTKKYFKCFLLGNNNDNDNPIYQYYNINEILNDDLNQIYFGKDFVFCKTTILIKEKIEDILKIKIDQDLSSIKTNEDLKAFFENIKIDTLGVNDYDMYSLFNKQRVKSPSLKTNGDIHVYSQVRVFIYKNRRFRIAVGRMRSTFKLVYYITSEKNTHDIPETDLDIIIEILFAVKSRPKPVFYDTIQTELLINEFGILKKNIYY